MAESAPLRYMMAERRSKKLSLHLSQNRVWLYGCCCFSAMRKAILLYTTVALGPIKSFVNVGSLVKKQTQAID